MALRIPARHVQMLTFNPRVVGSIPTGPTVLTCAFFPTGGARRAAERDEQQITAWREETWPQIKGQRRTWVPGESSRTSPVRGSGRPRAAPGVAAAGPR